MNTQTDLFFATFQAVAILMAIAAIGYWLVRKGTLGEQVLAPISVLAIDVALPCLIFVNITSNFNPTDLSWLSFPAAWAVFTVFAFLFTIAGGLLLPAGSRGDFRTCLFFQNGIFLPLNIIVQLFGADSPRLVELFLFTLLYPAFFFTAGGIFFGKGLQFERERILNPVLLSTIFALVVKFSGLDSYVPGFVIASLKQVGAMSIPLLMIIVGGSIYLDFRQRGRFMLREALTFIALKNFLFPLAVLGILVLLRPPYYLAFIILLQAAVPPVTALPVFADRFGGNRALVNQLIVISFIASLLSIPCILMLFSRFFPFM